jgi:hypothetical protein
MISRQLRTTSSATFALLTCLSAPSIAHAQPASSGASSEAAELFKQGRAALDAKDFPTACAKLAASLQLERATGTFMSLAICEEAQHKLASARQHWQEAAEFADATHDALNRGPFARQKLAALDPRVPRLTIHLVEGSPRDTAVKRDEIAMLPASYDAPFPVDPGAHTIVVTASHHASRTINVTLAEGEAKTVKVSPGADDNDAAKGTDVPPPPVADTPAPEKSPPPQPDITPATDGPSAEPMPANTGSLRTVGWVAGGVGVAAVGAGAIFGLIATGAVTSQKQDCSASSNCPNLAGANSEHSTAETTSTISTIAFIAGGALVATGIFLVLSAPTTQTTSSSTALLLAPSGVPGGMGLVLRGGF